MPSRRSIIRRNLESPFLTTRGHNTRTHRSRTYSSWWNMVARCRYDKTRSFRNYRGIGIRVCGGLERFSGFLAALGECPPKLEIDRWPNKFGHYSCGNCAECLQNGWPLNVRWATKTQNNRNRRDNRRISAFGIEGCMTEMAEYFGIHPSTVYQRLKRGLTPEQAFTAPKRKNQYA